MNRRETIAALAALAAAPLSVKAQQFPSKPITLICPWPAGGSTDVTLRSFSGAMGRFLGQPMVIENRPGASGTMGASAMVSARPDGHTLTQIHFGVLRLPIMQKTGFDPLKDLTFIIGLTGYTFGIVVRADARWKNFKEVMDWARENPGKLTYASSGIGSGPHVVMEDIAARMGAKLLHVPYKGGAEGIQALLGGHVMMFPDSTGWAPQVNDGRFRLLVTWGAERTRSWPEVPTLKELGIDIVWVGPYGIAGPRGMEPQVVKIIHDAFRKALDDEQVRKTLERLDQPVLYVSTEDYADVMRKRFEVERGIVEKFGLRQQN